MDGFGQSNNAFDALLADDGPDISEAEMRMILSGLEGTLGEQQPVNQDPQNGPARSTNVGAAYPLSAAPPSTESLRGHSYDDNGNGGPHVANHAQVARYFPRAAPSYPPEGAARDDHPQSLHGLEQHHGLLQIPAHMSQTSFPHTLHSYGQRDDRSQDFYDLRPPSPLAPPPLRSQTMQDHVSALTRNGAGQTSQPSASVLPHPSTQSYQRSRQATVSPRHQSAQVVQHVRRPQQPDNLVAGLFENVSTAPSSAISVHGSQDAVDLLRSAVTEHHLMVPDLSSTWAQIMYALASQMGIAMAQLQQVHTANPLAHIDIPDYEGVPLPFNQTDLDVDQIIRDIQSVRWLNGDTVGQLIILTQHEVEDYHVQLVRIWPDLPATNTVYLFREVLGENPNGGYTESWHAFLPRPHHLRTDPRMATNTESSPQSSPNESVPRSGRKSKVKLPRRNKNPHNLPRSHKGADRYTEEEILDGGLLTSEDFFGELFLWLNKKYTLVTLGEKINSCRFKEANAAGVKYRPLGSNAITKRRTLAIHARAQREGRDFKTVAEEVDEDTYRDKDTPKAKARRAAVGQAPKHLSPRKRKGSSSGIDPDTPSKRPAGRPRSRLGRSDDGDAELASTVDGLDSTMVVALNENEARNGDTEPGGDASSNFRLERTRSDDALKDAEGEPAGRAEGCASPGLRESGSVEYDDELDAEGETDEEAEMDDFPEYHEEDFA